MRIKKSPYIHKCATIQESYLLNQRICSCISAGTLALERQCRVIMAAVCCEISYSDVTRDAIYIAIKLREPHFHFIFM